MTTLILITAAVLLVSCAFSPRWSVEHKAKILDLEKCCDVPGTDGPAMSMMANVRGQLPKQLSAVAAVVKALADGGRS